VEKADLPAVSLPLLDRAFDALSRTARVSGVLRTVSRALTGALASGLPEPGTPVRVLDVGAGRGDLLGRLEKDLGKEGRTVDGISGEPHPAAARLARRARPGARLVRLSAPRIPLAGNAVDFVISTLTLHHLDRDDAVLFLREAHRVARRGWIVVDLRRTLPTRLMVELLSATVWLRNPLPRHDGPVSVRRAFRTREIEDLLAEAGIGRAGVRRGPPLHLTITGGELYRGEP
jgi:SAM-dependent methyltransferase